MPCIRVLKIKSGSTTGLLCVWILRDIIGHYSLVVTGRLARLTFVLPASATEHSLERNAIERNDRSYGYNNAI